MTPHHSDRSLIYLKPGEIYFGERPALVRTILGSCVSVTMFNPRFKIGAICHALLPTCGTEDPCDAACDGLFRYVDCAVRGLVSMFERKGIWRHEITAKVFGGSTMLTSGNGTKLISMGKQNIDAVKKVLHREELEVAGFDVGGTFARRVLFFADTGDVLMKRIGQPALSGTEGPGAEREAGNSQNIRDPIADDSAPG
jgi:chemotaxis protein CheD